MSGIRLGGRRTRNVIAPVATVSLGETLDASTVERAIDAVSTKVDEMLAGPGAYVADVDLVVGDNVITHGLGRKPSLVSVYPHTAVASFAWGWNPNQTGARLDMLTTIEVVGVPLRARVVVE